MKQVRDQRRVESGTTNSHVVVKPQTRSFNASPIPASRSSACPYAESRITWNVFGGVIEAARQASGVSSFTIAVPVSYGSQTGVIPISGPRPCTRRHNSAAHAGVRL